jgi:bifunctional non-homologous end joining protein LigD
MLMRTLLARDRGRPEGFILPSQPTLHTEVPTGPGGDPRAQVRRLSDDCPQERGGGADLVAYGRSRTADFAAIVGAIEALEPDELVLDGEAVLFGADGLPDFNGLLRTEGQPQACLVAFDLLSVDGEDLRPLPLLAAAGAWRRWLSAHLRRFASPSTWMGHPAPPCMPMPAAWGLKASYRRS